MRIIKWAGLFSVLMMQLGCTNVPDKVEPVSGFELPRYLGQWHEVARLDHSFERNLLQVTATYSMREDGGVRVINRGIDAQSGKVKQAEGKAYFVEDETVGRLKVSFFGPFYGGYNIAKLAEDYSMVLVIGPSLDYAWILARSDQPDASQCREFYEAAEQIGITEKSWIRLLDCGLPANFKSPA
ncbi:lipocalin family protein [Thiomicrorhabdus chilensis]|uniref:lipocalin family protein n=1 Tax=Thiomicrorhabdus chilensis TaxID=63656 RepID=UPI00040C9DE3|nr:lipocalin family protein [Thiomicrorhabdus chilensis]